MAVQVTIALLKPIRAFPFCPSPTPVHTLFSFVAVNLGVCVCVGGMVIGPAMDNVN